MDEEKARKQAVKEYLSGKTSMRTLAKRYGCHHTKISRWVMRDAKEKEKRTMLKQAAEKAVLKGNEMPTDVLQLQEELRMAKLEIELLKAMIDVADEQFGTNIRKKAGARQS
jgi:transposase-like protein